MIFLQDRQIRNLRLNSCPEVQFVQNNGVPSALLENEKWKYSPDSTCQPTQG